MRDLYDRENKIKNTKKKFAEECKNCYKILEEFERCLRLNNYSLGRIEKYWTFLRRIHSLLETCFDKVTKSDIENFVIKVDSNEKWKEWTKVDFKRILKFFYRWFIYRKLEGDYPEIVKWIKTKMKKCNEKAPDQILTKEEIKLLSNQAKNPMEKAFVLCLYESGCRIGEFLNIRIKDIQFDQYGCFILISGKTGWRRVRIIDYSKDLLKWLDSHPTKNDPESFLWIDPKTGKRINPSKANALLKKLKEKSGITKKVYPHALRHARATHLAKILTEQQLKVYFGWVNDSRMASVYVHLSGKDVDEALLKAKGIKVKDQKEDIKQSIKKCPRCGENNSYLSHFCKRCGSPLDIKASFELEKLEDLLIEYFKVLGKIFPQAREKFIEIAKEKGMLDLFLEEK